MTRMLNRVPLTALRSFEAAARKLSFSGAAEELGVTPAAVSLQIRRLEDRIQRPLFVRGRGALHLSETGARLAPRLTQLISDLDHHLTDVIAVESAALRVSALPSLASKWLAPRLMKFSRLYPEYSVRLEGSDDLATFDRDDVDIAIRYGAGAYRAVHFQHLMGANAFPVCSPEYAAANRDLVGSPAQLATASLLHDEMGRVGEGAPTWASWFEAAGLAPQALPGPRFESLHMALSAAIAGEGVALGLTPMVDDDIAAGRLVRPFDIELESRYSFWLVCRSDRASERKIAKFRSWIARELKKGSELAGKVDSARRYEAA